MSKLIRDEDNKLVSVAPSPMPLTGSAVIKHLKACQSMAVDHVQISFEKFIEEFDEALNASIQSARSNQDAVDLDGVLRFFRKSRSELQRYYSGYFSEGFVRFKKKKLNTTVGSDVQRTEDDLSLVGNEDLEESIAITSLTQRADGYFAEPLWALNQRFAVLNGGEHVTESGNPVAPIQLCDAFRRAIKLLPIRDKNKILAYKVFDHQMLNVTRKLTEDINEYLKGQGILPHLRYTNPTGAVPASYLSEEDEGAEINEEAAFDGPSSENLSPEEYQAELLSAIRNLQDQLPASSVAPVGLPPGAVAVSEEQLVDALQMLQHQVTETPRFAPGGQTPAPVDVSAVLAQLKETLKSDDSDAEVQEGDMKTIDLVGMLFQYMLNDESLPDRVKALLSYLHTPFLKIAFIDPGFFEKPDHPARLLLNTLAEAGSRWVGNDGTQQYDIYEKIKAAVDKLLSEFDNDVKIITTLLLEFKSYTKNIIRRQELMEKRATEKAQGEEKLREVKLRVNDEIRKRTHNRELPSALLLFLLQPWSDFLSFALLRYGDQSEKWNKAIVLVDDVLWCIRPKTKETDKQKQADKHDQIVSDIRAGFETIGFDQAKGNKLIEAVTSLMKLAMQSKKAEPAPAPMRDKLEKIAAEKAGEPDAKSDVATPEEAQMVEKLKIIEFGTWFEFDGGRRLKIAWYNARTSHYMLVDQMGKRVDMMSGLDMARQMISKKAHIISGSSKPFFERALENIYQKLNEQATNQQSGAKET
ncbi:MAG: DUF1631 domain-containing protein [Agarilytica sp.]